MDENLNMSLKTAIPEGIKKKEIYRIPLSLQKSININKSISRHITRDLFDKGEAGKKKFLYWKKFPVKAISFLDEVCKQQSYHFMKKSARTSSPIIKMLLRIRGENKLEQTKELQEKQENEYDRVHAKANAIDIHNIKARETNEKPKTITEREKETLQELAPDFIKEIKEKSEALAHEDRCKQELIKQAKEKGWLGVTIEEIDIDLTENYRKISKQLSNVKDFEKEELDLLRMLQSIRHDKMDIQKFQMLMQVKLAELEERKKMREKIQGKYKFDEMG